MQTSARLLFKQIVIVLGAIGFTCQAQSQRTCDSYVGKELASEILGKMLANDPGKGQYSKDQNLEWHLCQWVVDYPPVAPGAPRNPASLFVSIQRYPTLDAMRKGQISDQELGPKVKIERVARFGELGGVYTNNDLNTIGVAGNKGTKVMSISVEMGLNPIPKGTRKRIEDVAAKLWNDL